MTPRQADIAFALERVEGARAVLAIRPGTPASAHYDVAVGLEHGGRVLAEAHYALLHVLGHDDCARVYLFTTHPPAVVMEAAAPLVLTDTERREARARAVPMPPRPPIVSVRPPDPEALVVPPVGPDRDPRVLIVDDDRAVERVVRAVLQNVGLWTRIASVGAAARVAEANEFDLVLCDAKRAFGTNGLLAKLPMDVAQRVLVLVQPHEVVDARWRLQGTERLLTKPLVEWVLRERLVRLGAMPMLGAPDPVRVAAPVAPRRPTPPAAPGAPFSALLVDLDEDVSDALRRVFREESRHVWRRDPEEAAALVLSTPFHLVLCSANAALHPRSVLTAVALVDRTTADRIVVLAPTRDVPYVKHKLALAQLRNHVLALPLDEAALGQAVFRAHPELVARLAVAAVAEAPSTMPAPPRWRRPAVLVVDDDLSTEILLAAAAADPGARSQAELSLAKTSVAAFEHLVTRAVDLLLVSASMRADGGEPIYRVLWRLRPELKARCVLITSDTDVIPPSTNVSTNRTSHMPRIVVRPVNFRSISILVKAFIHR